MATGWSSGTRATVLDVLATRLGLDARGPFLDFCDDGTVMTAAELDGSTARVASGLDALGVLFGDRVATLLSNGPEICLSFFATLRLGGVLVPVNTANKGEFLRHQLADSGAKVLVCAEEHAGRVAEVAQGCPELESVVLVPVASRPSGTGPNPSTPSALPGVRSISWESLMTAAHIPPDPAGVGPEDLAALIYTAGTTGPSKGCMLSHNYLVNLASQIARTWGRRPDDVIWTPLPLFHLNAWVIAVLGTLVTGGRAAISRRFSVTAFWATMNRTGATIASLLGAPAAFVANAAEDPEQERNTSLRLVAAAPMSPEISEAYRERFGVETFSAGYGLTEASLISSLPPGTANKPGAAGMVNSSEFDVRVFDDSDSEVPRGAVGEVVVRPLSPNVMFEGYWRRPEATVETSRNWWFHTGDLGRVDTDGYLYFVDRKKDCLRRRGENISSFEMETTFLAHPDIAEVAVHPVPSSVAEDDVKVTAVLRDGARLSEADLCTWCLDKVPYFAVPRYVEFRSELPRNPVGRVLKYALREDGVTASTWDREESDVEVPRG